MEWSGVEWSGVLCSVVRREEEERDEEGGEVKRGEERDESGGGHGKREEREMRNDETKEHVTLKVERVLARRPGTPLAPKWMGFRHRKRRQTG